MGVPEVIAAVAAAAGLFQQKVQATQQRVAAYEASLRQERAMDKLAQSLGGIGVPTDAEKEAQRKAEEAQKAKEAAEKRASDLEAGVQADTEAAALRRRSLVGLAATVETSAAGIVEKATVEKKSLLGQGGAY